MPITKIVSGGQTGADRGGLDAAIYCEIPHGGWCPQGRKAEDGVIPDEYKLTETKSKDYLKRTEANIVDSDATIVFTLGKATGGSLRTIEFADKHKRACLHIDVDSTAPDKAVELIITWLNSLKPKDDSGVVLNVAGSRESKADGIAGLVMAIMVGMLRVVNPDCGRFYPVKGV